ncbi:MAG TPA: MarR family winged helix-turn-helix transcriptional regulator [Myxococcaceae bacterium]|jgi:DNA-binding MarR family transcriptional regulator
MSRPLQAAAGRRWARQLLVSALGLARAALRASAAPELAVPEALVLWWLTRYPGCTVGQLSVDLGVEASGISVAVQGLERRKLLARVRDPRDRRRSFLRVTAPGRRAAAIALGDLEDRLEAAAAGVSPAQLETAGQVLSSLLEALRAPRSR